MHSPEEDMMADMNVDAMGRFIYGAARFGGKLQDVTDWIADDLGASRLPAGDDDATRGLWDAFFAKHADNNALRENYERFISMLRNRPATN